MNQLAEARHGLEFDREDLSELRLSAERGIAHHGRRAPVEYPLEQTPALAALYEELLNQYKPERTDRTVDFGLDWNGLRWRGHLYHHMHGWSATMRALPEKVATLGELDFDEEQVLSIARDEGLVIFAGATASGKSTTMAALMGSLDHEGLLGDAVSIENPIEYVHKSHRIEQREVGTDTASFATGVVEAMRQTPKTIVIGEIRDPETADAAVQAGLTGHRVLATLHAKNLRDAIVRLTSILPAHQRSLLATALQGIMVQSLIRIPNQPPVPIYETLEINDSVAGIIDKGTDSLNLLNHEFRHQGRRKMDEMRAELVSAGIIAR